MSAPREVRLELWGIAALALAATGLVAASLRHGMPMSLDGWFYWQGSVSLLEGLGFRAFDGEPIRAWPPLYSSTLAATQAVSGVSARGLALSTALVTGSAVLIWAGLIRWYAGRRGDRSRVVLAVAWVAVLLVLNARELRAENLARALLPLLIWATLRGGGAATRRERFASAFAAALTLLALLATRNPALALAPGVAAVFLLGSAAGRAERAVAAAIAVAIPVAGWLALRAALGQEASHDAGLGAARHGPLAYLWQLLRGVDRATSFDFVGLPLLIALGLALLRSDARGPGEGDGREGALLLVLVGIALAALLALFSLTHVADRLRGRFVVWVPLTIGALGIVDSRRLLTRRVALLFFLLLFLQPTLRVAKHALRGRDPDLSSSYDPATLRRFAPTAATIHPTHVRLPPKETGDGLILVSPAFPRAIAEPTTQ